MSCFASVIDFFRTSRWFLNLVSAILCLLIPVAGLMAVLGWLSRGLWGRRSAGQPDGFPAFSFGEFSENVARGAAPFAVGLVGGLLLVPLAVILFYNIPLMGEALFTSSGFMSGLVTVVVYALAALAWLAFYLVMSPIMLRAAMTQEFGAAYSAPFVRRFVAATKSELFLSALFIAALGAASVALGFIPPYIAPLVLAPISLFAWQHLLWQLYHLYLRRGGQPVAISPTLSVETTPPPMASQAQGA